MAAEAPIEHDLRWPVVSLAEIATKIGSGATPKGGADAYLPARARFALVRSQNVFDRRFDHAGLAFITDEQSDGLRGVVLQPADILLNITGDGITFARACIVPKDVLPACVNQHVSIIRVDPRGADAGYVLAFLTHPGVKSYIESFNAGGSRRAITKGHIESFRLPLPPLPEQRAIAHILGTLDDKIELNRRMNETLEAMARAIFNSWFVDFDPVRAKADGRDPGLPKPLADLFPARFADSELGAIPAGWQEAALGDLCWRIAMGPFGSDIKTDNFVESGVPVVRGGNLTHGFVDEGFVFVSEDKADDLRNANAFPGDIVITHRGTLGQVGLIPRSSRFRRYVVSQSQMLLSVNPDLATPRYIFEYLRSPMGQHAVLANTSSTGVPAIARPTSSVRAIRLLQPPVPVLASFERTLGPLIERGNGTAHETRSLAALRDALLAKLISGELRVKDANRIVAAHS